MLTKQILYLFDMKRWIPVFISLLFSVNGFSQNAPMIKRYTVEAQIDSNCATAVSLDLFDTAYKKFGLNFLISDELLKPAYSDIERHRLLFELYKENGSRVPLFFSVTSNCSFSKNDIYSFTACTYNACDNSPKSNYEAGMITVDALTGKVMKLTDIIDPEKIDSFENYIYTTAVKYHVKNVPTCFISSINPVMIKGSNNVTAHTDTIKYFKELTGKFYLSENNLLVFLKAVHRDYTYTSVEVMTPLFYTRYFLKPEIAKRLGL